MTKRAEEILFKLRDSDGGAFSTSEVLSFENFTSKKLYELRELNIIIFWQDEHGCFFYPKWQFMNEKIIFEISLVLSSLSSNDSTFILAYFLQPKEKLNGLRPIDMIMSGKTPEVLDHVLRFNQEL